jgi:hypothetical protein
MRNSTNLENHLNQYSALKQALQPVNPAYGFSILSRTIALMIAFSEFPGSRATHKIVGINLQNIIGTLHLVNAPYKIGDRTSITSPGAMVLSTLRALGIRGSRSESLLLGATRTTIATTACCKFC